jgi:3-isopropylmalate dehydratase small subunit
VDNVEGGEEIAIDFSKGAVQTSRGNFDFIPLPDSILRILDAGGLIPYTKLKMRKEK